MADGVNATNNDGLGSYESYVKQQETNRQATSGALDQDAFLYLLVQQLKNQDPLEPVKDTDFIAQMAQFSSLQQMQNLNTNFMSNQAYNLMGKYVYGTVASTNGPLVEVFGMVQSVVHVDGKPYLQVVQNNGSVVNVEVGNVSAVLGSGLNGADDSFMQSSNLIGKNVVGYMVDENGDYIKNTEGEDMMFSGEVKEIYFKNGAVYAKVSGGTDESGNAIIKEFPVGMITQIGSDPITIPDQGTEAPKTTP